MDNVGAAEAVCVAFLSPVRLQLYCFFWLCNRSY